VGFVKLNMVTTSITGEKHKLLYKNCARLHQTASLNSHSHTSMAMASRNTNTAKAFASRHGNDHLQHK
jgi:hypothetical protein